MAEVSARQKFACPSCGGESVWNPAKHALVCPFCGTVSPAEINATTGEITEHDLAAALRNIPAEARGWQTEKTAVKCQSCQAISVFDPTRVAQRCDFCGSSSIIPFEQIKAPIRPESLLEFKIAETPARDAVREWYASRWWAPNALKSRALTDTVRGIYIPYWTFDAQVQADWTADAGYYYYESESYTDAQGRRQTRQVRRVRWVPASGSLDHFFDDELVPASQGVQAELLRKIEPFPTTSDLKSYDPGYLSGWVVEQYQIDLIAAAQHSQEIIDGKTRDLCSREVPGDTQRNLAVETSYSGQTFKHILVPIWLISYTYGAQGYQVVINGYTGTIAGRYPLSWVKISLAVFAALLAVLIIWIFSQSSGHASSTRTFPEFEQVKARSLYCPKAACNC